MESAILPVKNSRRLKVLTRREARIVDALAQTFFPADGREMPTVKQAGVVGYFDELLSDLRLREKVLIRAMLVLLEMQSLVLNGFNPVLFTNAPAEVRTKTMASWESSGIFKRRLTFYAIRTLLLWAYADSTEVEEAIGFPSPAVVRTRRQAAAQRAISEAMGQNHEHGDGATPSTQWQQDPNKS